MCIWAIPEINGTHPIEGKLFFPRKYYKIPGQDVALKNRNSGKCLKNWELYRKKNHLFGKSTKKRYSLGNFHAFYTLPYKKNKLILENSNGKKLSFF